ncbi:hypothetical protein [Nitrosomonas eutropha]|nr:hypothetical protein [Nitrosomonas eutropha]
MSQDSDINNEQTSTQSLIGWFAHSLFSEYKYQPFGDSYQHTHGMY